MSGVNDFSTAASDHSLLRRWREGQEAAAAELYERYSRRLQGLARAQLSAELSRQVEVDDIVQSVFGSLFRGVSDALYDVPADEELWKLLLVIALHKIRKKAAYFRARKRDTRRTLELTDELEALVEDPSAARAYFEVVVDEVLGKVACRSREIVELRMQGLEVQEIAARVKRSKRTVERLLQQARAELAALLSERDVP